MSNLRVTSFQHEKTGTTSRVWTSIDDQEMWFESDDVDLEPSVEALATLLLIPALLSKRNLEIEQPVCPTWYENAHKVMDFLNFSWAASAVEILALTKENTGLPRAATGLFFTGGVDSFYTFFSIPRPDFLIYLETFDVPNEAEKRSRIARERLQKIATAVGSHPITIRTNAKKHPTFSAHSFTDTHASLLAAAGHLLAPHIVSATISPSWHKSHHMVSGSNWRLDPLWSSARLQIIHGENSLHRIDRVKAIADQTLVQENLHVCFENHNCSRCEKCVRTMLELHQAGKLAEFKVFDQGIPVWEAIDNLPRVLHPVFFEPALSNNPTPELEKAVRHLFRRTSIAARAIEDQLKQRRYVDEEFPKIQEGLNNALHHYALLQEDHKRLSDDYALIVGNLPIQKSIRLVRKVAKTLRGGSSNRGARHE
ncbi:MAG: hypothetical protein IT342_14010 [Candidatus Melainabacteria bacterium]|nr:hypothetical protein [Candidatus Melainabacteria bacterium]